MPLFQVEQLINEYYKYILARIIANCSPETKQLNMLTIFLYLYEALSVTRLRLCATVTVFTFQPATDKETVPNLIDGTSQRVSHSIAATAPTR